MLLRHKVSPSSPTDFKQNPIVWPELQQGSSLTGPTS